MGFGSVEGDAGSPDLAALALFVSLPLKVTLPPKRSFAVVGLGSVERDAAVEHGVSVVGFASVEDGVVVKDGFAKERSVSIQVIVASEQLAGIQQGERSDGSRASGTVPVVRADCIQIDQTAAIWPQPQIQARF